MINQNEKKGTDQKELTLQFKTAEDGTIIITHLLPNDTIASLKKNLSKLQTGIPFDQQGFVFKGQLLDNNKMICDYPLEDNSIINVAIKKLSKPIIVSDKSMTLFVKNLKGQTDKITNIRANDAVSKIKEKILEKYGISLSEQRLVYAGHQLEDNDQLNQYAIHEHSSIVYYSRLGGK